MHTLELPRQDPQSSLTSAFPVPTLDEYRYSSARARGGIGGGSHVSVDANPFGHALCGVLEYVVPSRGLRPSGAE